MKWISTKIEKPKDGQKCLVTQVGEGGHTKEQYLDRIWIATYQKSSDTFWTDGGPYSVMQVHCVINWMPLPRAPKMGEV